jgi:hypothetical protein
VTPFARGQVLFHRGVAAVFLIFGCGGILVGVGDLARLLAARAMAGRWEVVPFIPDAAYGGMHAGDAFSRVFVGLFALPKFLPYLVIGVFLLNSARLRWRYANSSEVSNTSENN